MSRSGSRSAASGARCSAAVGRPFIVTGELPPGLLAWADGLRRAHFPPERNHLAAHVTLFHSFAPSLREALPGVLADLAASTPPPPARITGLMDLGSGTALAIESPAMLALREEIAAHFHGALTAQDRHPPRLHITIQNKVTPAVARALQAALGKDFGRRSFRFAGLALQLYHGPGWEQFKRWSFRGQERS